MEDADLARVEAELNFTVLDVCRKADIHSIFIAHDILVALRKERANGLKMAAEEIAAPLNLSDRFAMAEQLRELATRLERGEGEDGDDSD